MSFSLAFLTFALCAIAAPALTPPSFMLWRYRDLKMRGFVTSRAMLKIMIEQYGFPAGKRLAPQIAEHGRSRKCSLITNCGRPTKKIPAR